MKIITTINSNDVKAFLNSKADALMVGLEGYTTYLDKTFKVEEIKEIVKEKKDKEIYLVINRIIENDEIAKVYQIIEEVKELDLAGFVILDMGLLEILLELGLKDKIVFSPSTYLTNKDSASYFSSLGIKRIVPSKEISLENIIEIKKNTTCQEEVMVYGYRNIFYSKRKVISLYNENYKIKEEVAYLKEEKRENLFPIRENKQGTFVFSSSCLNLVKYLFPLLENEIDYINIESNFIKDKDIIKIISFFKKVIDLYPSKEEMDKYISSVDFEECDEGFINKDSVYMQEEYE